MSLDEKKQISLTERLSILDRISDSVNKKIGKKVMGRIGKDAAIMDKLKIKFIQTPSVSINDAIGGGFPRGRMTLISGKEDSGKTGLALETIAYNMKQDPNFVAAWLESENSLEKDYVCEMFGIDPDRFLFIEHERDGAGEGALDIAEATINSGAIDIFVVNSLKCLVPSEEFSKTMGEHTIGIQARMNSKMSRKFTPLIAESGTSFIIIQHLSTEIGKMGHDPLSISGGLAIRFFSSLTLDLRKRSISQSDPISKEEGIKVNLKVKKNHCVPDRNPYLAVEYYAIFGQGIEQTLSVLQKALEQGVLLQKGAFIRDPDPTGEPKVIDGYKRQWQGQKQFKDYIHLHPEFLEELRMRVTEVRSLSSEEIDEIQKEEEEIENTMAKTKKTTKK